MKEEYEAYHTDVQKVIDGLAKINDVFDSAYLKEAMWMLANQSWQIKSYRNLVEVRDIENGLG